MQTLRCRIPAKPFQLTAQFFKGRSSDGFAAAVSTYSRRVPLRRMMMAPRYRHARPALRHSRRLRDDDGPESGARGQNVGGFTQADVLVEGKKILAVGPNLHAGGAAEIDARGRIVMPGFIDTHHHQFETALRSFLADGVLINDGSGSPSGSTTYYEYILLKFAPVYRPQDVYINELFGGLSQLDDGVTTVHDVSQIHHTPQHSDAAIQALIDTGRRAAFGYFESAGLALAFRQYEYPQDANRINNQWFSPSTPRTGSCI